MHEYTRPISPAGASACAIAHPCAGRSQRSPNAAHSGSDGSVRGGLLTRQHDLGRLDDGGDLVAFGKAELLGTRTGHDGDDLVVSDLDDDLRHDAAESDRLHGAAKLVTRADLHRSSGSR